MIGQWVDKKQTGRERGTGSEKAHEPGLKLRSPEVQGCYMSALYPQGYRNQHVVFYVCVAVVREGLLYVKHLPVPASFPWAFNFATCTFSINTFHLFDCNCANIDLLVIKILDHFNKNVSVHLLLIALNTQMKQAEHEHPQCARHLKLKRQTW